MGGSLEQDGLNADAIEQLRHFCEGALIKAIGLDVLPIEGADCVAHWTQQASITSDPEPERWSHMPIAHKQIKLHTLFVGNCEQPISTLLEIRYARAEQSCRQPNQGCGEWRD